MDEPRTPDWTGGRTDGRTGSKIEKKKKGPFGFDSSFQQGETVHPIAYAIAYLSCVCDFKIWRVWVLGGLPVSLRLSFGSVVLFQQNNHRANYFDCDDQ